MRRNGMKSKYVFCSIWKCINDMHGITTKWYASRDKDQHFTIWIYIYIYIYKCISISQTHVIIQWWYTENWVLPQFYAWQHNDHIFRNMLFACLNLQWTCYFVHLQHGKCLFSILKFSSDSLWSNHPLYVCGGAMKWSPRIHRRDFSSYIYTAMYLAMAWPQTYIF